jgi:DNA-binding transcriptional MerR regulator
MAAVPDSQVSSDDEITIDELARLAKLPVRTIREYQTMRVLPPPVRRGRVGFYSTVHLERLALISRLQQRGYSLAGIRDLLATFEAGANLPSLLGVNLGAFALDEVPLRLTRVELSDRLPGLDDASLRRALDVGLIYPDGRRHYLIRSPALLTLVADGVGAGVPIATMLDFAAAMRNHLNALAATIADRVIGDVWESLAANDRGEDIESFLRRGRPLLLQAVASILADRLGDALGTRATNTPAGDALRVGIEHVRVGAVVDGQGNLEHRKRT